MFRSRNWPLLIGALLSAACIAVALIGPRFAPYDPMAQFNWVMELDGQAIIPTRKPVPPGLVPDVFLLGTDEAGRDIFSRLLYAVRPTLLVCTVAVAIRAILGVACGLLAGWHSGLARRLVDLAIGASLSLPALVFCAAAISFFGIDKGLGTFLIALSVTGWADIAAFVRNQTVSTLQSQFIESARAVGVRPRRILTRHVLPQLWPALPSLISFETGTVLLLLAELGFLGIYIGGGFIYEVPRGDNPGTWKVLTAGYPELGQMLSSVWAKIIFVPWEPLIVGGAVLVMVFAFNMLGEGLRRHMDISRAHRQR